MHISLFVIRDIVHSLNKDGNEKMVKIEMDEWDSSVAPWKATCGKLLMMYGIRLFVLGPRTNHGGGLGVVWTSSS